MAGSLFLNAYLLNRAHISLLVWGFIQLLFELDFEELVWGGRWEGGSGLGTRLHPWRIHVDVWQNQYSIVKQKKRKRKKYLEFKKEKANWRKSTA